MSKEKQQKIGIELSSSPFRWLYHYISKHQRRTVILSVDLRYALVDNPLPLYQPEFIGVQSSTFFRASSIQYLGISYRLPSVAKAFKASLSTKTFLKPNSSVKVTTCRHACASTMVEFNTCSFGNFWALQILRQVYKGSSEA
ncbi:uncharacterized protein [Gossypium hirsutum]|uniref:Uncharacterized protein isoform X12 n=1 Tax=Gossypium hirsutum TaxID=3635 RepID=A0ABM3ALK6_GOSHI|nr:uncharacterized protein LOC107909094 isoform X12 [Gossypium hirsutum]